jgi:hypothetical protein
MPMAIRWNTNEEQVDGGDGVEEPLTLQQALAATEIAQGLFIE